METSASNEHLNVGEGTSSKLQPNNPAVEEMVEGKVSDLKKLDDENSDNETSDKDECSKTVSYLEVDKCKSCKKRLKSILQHLNKSKDCIPSYSEDDMNRLKAASKSRTKERKKIWLKENKGTVTQQNAARYQRNKDTITQKYHENKETISKKRREYYLKEDMKVRDRVAEYYQKNKEKIAQKYQENKKAIQKKRADREKHLQWTEYVDSGCKMYLSFFLMTNVQKLTL